MYNFAKHAETHIVDIVQSLLLMNVQVDTLLSSALDFIDSAVSLSLCFLCVVYFGVFIIPSDMRN